MGFFDTMLEIVEAPFDIVRGTAVALGEAIGFDPWNSTGYHVKGPDGKWHEALPPGYQQKADGSGGAELKPGWKKSDKPGVAAERIDDYQEPVTKDRPTDLIENTGVQPMRRSATGLPESSRIRAEETRRFGQSLRDEIMSGLKANRAQRQRLRSVDPFMQPPSWVSRPVNDFQMPQRPDFMGPMGGQMPMYYQHPYAGRRTDDFGF